MGQLTIREFLQLPDEEKRESEIVILLYKVECITLGADKDKGYRTVP